MRNVFRAVVADRITPHVFPADKRCIVCFIGIILVFEIFRLLTPGAVVTERGIRRLLRQRQGGGITVGIGYVDRGFAIGVGTVLFQIEVHRVADVSADGGYLLIQIERTPLRIPALRDDLRLEGDARRTLGRNPVRCG